MECLHIFVRFWRKQMLVGQQFVLLALENPTMLSLGFSIVFFTAGSRIRIYFQRKDQVKWNNEVIIWTSIQLYKISILWMRSILWKYIHYKEVSPYYNSYNTININLFTFRDVEMSNINYISFQKFLRLYLDGFIYNIYNTININLFTFRDVEMWNINYRSFQTLFLWFYLCRLIFILWTVILACGLFYLHEQYFYFTLF